MSVEIDDAQVIDVNLNPGQASIHHTQTLHRSGANESVNFRFIENLNEMQLYIED